jgi:peptide-methionine (S)-S-oxide reductase
MTRRGLGALGAVVMLALIAAPALLARGGGGAAVVLPAPAVDNPRAAGPPQVAVLAGGCFWGVQGVYQHVRGVRKAVSGYAGGTKETASYDAVSSGRTRHAESVEITFDPGEISYGEILQIFFSVVHDPTQLDRQGPDEGPHYRSNVFYADETQRKIAQAYLAQLGKARLFPGPIVTRVDPLQGFYPAEAYHQDFMIDNPLNPYIVIHDQPKLEALRTVFAGRYRERPVLVKGTR